jgi:hypothetical protein
MIKMIKKIKIIKMIEMIEVIMNRCSRIAAIATVSKRIGYNSGQFESGPRRFLCRFNYCPIEDL